MADHIIREVFTRQPFTCWSFGVIGGAGHCNLSRTYQVGVYSLLIWIVIDLLVHPTFLPRSGSNIPWIFFHFFPPRLFDVKKIIAFLAIAWNSKVFPHKKMSFIFQAKLMKKLSQNYKKKLRRGGVYISLWESGHRVYLSISTSYIYSIYTINQLSGCLFLSSTQKVKVAILYPRLSGWGI